MQHQQNRDDFAGAKTGLWPARRGAVPNQMGFPLRQKRLTKIVHRAKGFDEPLQHVDLSCHSWFGSILRLIDSQCVNASDTRYRGVLTAVAVVTAVDDPSRFKRSRSVGAYFGLTPKRYQSGEKDVIGRISLCGDPLVRSYLYEAANVLLART